MDVVIPFRSSLNRDEELMFTLRSLEKYLIGVGRVYIVGDTPKWQTSSEVTVIPMADKYDFKLFKDRNIVNKLLMACHDERIARDGFIAADDDMFLLSYVEARYCPALHRGSMWNLTGDYGETEKNTIALFPNKRPKNFNTHHPYIIIPAVFQEYMTRNINWHTPYGYSIKTVYCTRMGNDGEFYHNELNVKGNFSAEELNGMITGGMRYVTCQDNAFRYGMRQWLQNRFPEKSKYEI